MNEIVLELAKQAGLKKEHGSDREYIGDFDWREFAELIVRECAKFCDEVIKEVEIAMEQCEMVKTSDRLMMLHDGTRNGAQMSKIRIKKHFGVEE